MLCTLCDNLIKGPTHKTLIRGWASGKLIQTRVCERCWNKCDNVAEAVMAKKKAEKKVVKAMKALEIRPCEKCGRVDFNTDQARRAHQGRCLGKNPPPVLVKPKKIKAKVSQEAVKMLAGPPPEVKGKKVTVDITQDHTPEALEGIKKIGEKVAKKRKTKAEMTASDRGRGSKKKGNNFENEVKKIFAKWWGEPDNIVGSKASAFQRAPGSGGMSPTNWPLDLVLPKGFPWAVECKNREGDIGMDKMERFFTSKYPVVEWFKAAEEELVAADIKVPLLVVFTKNLFPIFVAFRRPAAGESHLIISEPHVTLCGQPFSELVIMRLDDLLKYTPDYWKDIYTAVENAGKVLKDQPLISSVAPRKWE